MIGFPAPPSRSLALLLALGASTLALPATASEAPAVLAPGPATVAVAGGRLEIAWEAPARVEFEEWEAFLSLDGGTTWPFRITPHLDRSVRRFSAPLPGVPSAAARLLLRYGDEREERELELPFSFEIRPSPWPLASPTVAPVARRGEAARGGSAGVVSWLDGPRDGGRTTLYQFREFGWGSDGPRFADAGARLLATEESERPRPRPASRRSIPAPALPSSGSGPSTSPAPAPPSGSERLALLSRRNE